TRYTTYRQNVLEGTNPWVFTNAYSEGNNTSDNMIRENWYNSGGAQIPNAEERNNQVIDNVSVSGTDWPQDAVEVICAAGVAPEYRTPLNANHPAFPQCPTE
ncbi:MAG TPA: right-handed parallel beta-helix repeat-containing protein, partial [Promicromonospora sp.]|nr:right-handed parallel beta-helix repeat-containing protein [Promicromonospora sp.]